MFLSYFNDKAASVRKSVIPDFTHQDISHPQCATFDRFHPIALSELLETLSHMRVTSSPLDILPTKFLLKVMDSVGPSLLSIFNSSLPTGWVPDYFKTACVNPLLKNPGQDPSQFHNYWPISKLPFISKILEKLMLKQLLPMLKKTPIYLKAFNLASESTIA